MQPGSLWGFRGVLDGLWWSMVAVEVELLSVLSMSLPPMVRSWLTEQLVEFSGSLSLCLLGSGAGSRWAVSIVPVLRARGGTSSLLRLVRCEGTPQHGKLRLEKPPARVTRGGSSPRNFSPALASAGGLVAA